MSAQFFGQFLIVRGEIDAGQIREALILMASRNRSLGQIAVDEGILQSLDVARVHAAQRSRDVAFGDLCVELRLLTASQLVELLRTQHENRLRIGEALVELGHLEADRLPVLLDVFKATQSEFTTDQIALPDALANHRAVQPVLSLFPRILRRVGGMQVKVGEIHALDSVPDFAEVRVSIPLHGVQGLDIALVSNSEFAERLASATSGLTEIDLDAEMVEDGVGEFLNVLLGNVLAALQTVGHPMELGPPDYEAELAGGWVVDLAAEFGRAAIVLSLF
jgi:CheY-specific phosphatase CheX